MPRCTSEDSTIRDANIFVIGTILTNRLIHRVSQFEYTHVISLEEIFNFYHRALILVKIIFSTSNANEYLSFLVFFFFLFFRQFLINLSNGH